MGLQTASFQLLSSRFANWVAPNSAQTSIRTSNLFPLQNPHILKSTNLNLHNPRFERARTGAALDEQNATSPLLGQEPKPNRDVEESVKVLKEAAKTRKVPKDEVLSALSVIEKAKLDPSRFLDTLGGSKSPGRTWMLIFTSEKQLKGGRYFPLTAVQRQRELRMVYILGQLEP
ncbi:uncharacterized protein LOC21403784 isoform X3 [Morus notabilis]|uniref:uncharacterized protein LOC21403784 isoform X3 n=1 Tax=Morus notabilis TaxID=981085 RepID=UPI000CECE992|nr:uncharacterized protein LOC21403784 isoform X3 [Morus notabilis]XP_024023577.1 uncharacterized protein LOC21403784 isoform X3 [Morus notabilis]